jgi:hypothetical protein
MTKLIAVAGVATAAGALAGVVRRVRNGSARQPSWLGVTVQGTPEQIAPGGELPEPLRRLGDRIEVRMQPAPGDRGTEVRARLRRPAPSSVGSRLTGRDALAPVRVALRQAKALVETGEIVRSDERRTPHPGPVGRVLQAVDGASMGSGRL